MNLLSWQKIEKVKIEYCKDETFLLQFFLENKALRGFFIRNGEFDKGLYTGKEKISLNKFFNYGLIIIDLLCNLVEWKILLSIFNNACVIKEIHLRLMCRVLNN